MGVHNDYIENGGGGWNLGLRSYSSACLISVVQLRSMYSPKTDFTKDKGQKIVGFVNKVGRDF